MVCSSSYNACLRAYCRSVASSVMSFSLMNTEKCEFSVFFRTVRRKVPAMTTSWNSGVPRYFKMVARFSAGNEFDVVLIIVF